MSSIQALTQQCLQSFQELLSRLKSTCSEFLYLMPLQTLEDELGKFRVWCGNLGALQIGYAALDYRLRESTVMQTNISKLLQQLDSNLKESIDVVSGIRLPFEEQPRPSDLSEDSTDESDMSNNSKSRHELSMRLSSIIDIRTNLYQLSYKIRNPSLAPTSNKPALLRQIDKETKVDLFDTLLEFDEKALKDLLASLRRGRKAPDDSEDFLVERLVASITLRRKYFKYWQQHAKKLDRRPEPPRSVRRLVQALSPDYSDVGSRPHTIRRQPDTLFNPSKILSNTNATPYDPALDDQTEKGSFISLTSTAIDADGKGVGIPRPPVEAIQGQPFTCPYCSVLCPPTQGRGKAWRAHVLHDLQPYLCTYENCTRGSELYRSRKRWLEHEEMAHRCSWRCRDHPDTLYGSVYDFQSHLARDHSRDISREQMDEITHISAVGHADEREMCPICFDQQPFPNGLTNHLANHLERIALFALPTPVPEVDGSQNQSQLSLQMVIASRSSKSLPESTSFQGDEKGKRLDNERHTSSLGGSNWEWPPELGLEPTTNYMLRTKLRPMAEDLDTLLSCLQVDLAQQSDNERAVVETAILSVQRCLTLTEWLREMCVSGSMLITIPSLEAIRGPAASVGDFLKILVENLQAPWEGSFGDRQFSLPNSAQSISVISALGAIGRVHHIIDGTVDAVSGGFEVGVNKMGRNQGILKGILSTDGFHQVPSGHDHMDAFDDANFDPRFKKQHPNCFRPGEVFKIVWPEVSPPREDLEIGPLYRDQYGGLVQVYFRRFLILAADVGHCQCLPISTYGRKGLKKDGVYPVHHGIVYEKGKEPRVIDGEPEARFPPVRVTMHVEDQHLLPESRVNYAKLTTIEYAWKVFFIGTVSGGYMNIVSDAMDTCWSNKIHHRRRRR